MSPPPLDDFWDTLSPHVAWMHRQLRRLGVHPNDLDDVTQDVLVALHRRWSEYDRARSLRSYLFGFLFRTASDYRRRAHRRDELAGVEDSRSVLRTTPEDIVNARDELNLVQRALDQIPEGRREVFVMAAIERHTIPEVAETMGIPMNTAYSRLRVAKREFMEAVEMMRRERGMGTG